MLTTPLLAVVQPPMVERVALPESLNRDLNRVSEWCDFWVMKLDDSKTLTVVVSTSSTIRPQSTLLILDGTVMKESDDLVHRLLNIWTMQVKSPFVTNRPQHRRKSK